MEARKTRTPQEIRAEWNRMGLSQAEWARKLVSARPLSAKC